MPGVTISELKARLSEHLRQVRSGGTVTVLDRRTPIARIVPFQEDSARLTKHPATRRLSRIARPPSAGVARDALARALAQERQAHR